MTLRVACVGAGYFSQFHIGSWARIPQVDLAGIFDRDEERAKNSGVPAFASLAKMIGTVRPDILDVILPPSAQAAVLRDAIDMRVPTIICQKPFCTDLAQATEITTLAEAAGVRLIIHENFRFQPWYRAIKRAIDAGEIGQVRQATFRLRPGDGQGPQAYLARQPYFQKMPRFLIHETGVHWVDTFRYLFGPPTHVYADLRRENPAIAGEDAGFVLFDHANGVRSLLDGNRVLDHAADNTRRTMGEALIEGDAGTLTLLGDGSVQHRRFGRLDQITRLSPDTHQGFGGDCTHALQRHVVDALVGQGVFENQAKQYLPVIMIKDLIYQSAETGQKLAIGPS